MYQHATTDELVFIFHKVDQVNALKLMIDCHM